MGRRGPADGVERFPRWRGEGLRWGREVSAAAYGRTAPMARLSGTDSIGTQSTINAPLDAHVPADAHGQSRTCVTRFAGSAGCLCRVHRDCQVVAQTRDSNAMAAAIYPRESKILRLMQFGYYTGMTGMLRRLYVHNFRCLENFELAIADKATILLIGKNGAGKSTVGLALEIVQRIARGTNKIDDLVKPKDLARGRADVPMRFEIEADLAAGRYVYSIALELPPGFKYLRVAEEKLNFNGKAVYERSTAEVRLSKGRPEYHDATFRVDWHLAALPIIQEQSSSEPIAVFRRWLAAAAILRPVPSLISGKSDQESLEPDPSLQNFSEWFSGVIASAPSAYSLIDGYLKQIMPDLNQIKNPLTGNDSRSLIIEFADKNGAASVPFEDLSDGEKCFMICSLILAANETYGPLLCYWDEPDCCLAPHEVGQLTMALRQAFEANGQLIITSHNSEVVGRFSNENTILLHRRSHIEPTTVHLVDKLSFAGDLVDALIRGDVEP